MEREAQAATGRPVCANQHVQHKLCFPVGEEGGEFLARPSSPGAVEARASKCPCFCVLLIKEHKPDSLLS